MKKEQKIKKTLGLKNGKQTVSTDRITSIHIDDTIAIEDESLVLYILYSLKSSVSNHETFAPTSSSKLYKISVRFTNTRQRDITIPYTFFSDSIDTTKLKHEFACILRKFTENLLVKLINSEGSKEINALLSTDYLDTYIVHYINQNEIILSYEQIQTDKLPF